MSDVRRRYLAEIGIPVYELRRRGVAHAAPVAPAAREPASAAAPIPPQVAKPPTVVARAAAPVADPLVAPPAGPAVVPVVAPAATPSAISAIPAGDAWEPLAAEVRGCTLCGLHSTRTQTVFGVGRRDADLLVIGEAPGADEDRQGEPFVGRAGQLLNEMLRAMGSPRRDVYIANILKCRPPGNRDPKPEEATACTPYLSRQIALLRPKAILAVGRIAAQWLLQTDSPIGRLRGRVFQYGESGTPLVVTYHPAYLLRSPLEKAKAWTDLCVVKDLLQKQP